MKWISKSTSFCIKSKNYRITNIEMIFMKKISKNKISSMKDLVWNIKRSKINWKSKLLARLIMVTRRRPRSMKVLQTVNLLRLTLRHWFCCRKFRISEKDKLLIMWGELRWFCQVFQNQAEYCKQFRYN